MTAAVDKIVNSVLYEGYMLYPYRRSSLKNRHRWNFGIVYPQGLEPGQMKTECLIEGSENPALHVEVRFLQLYEKDSCEEVVERRISIEDTGDHSREFDHLQCQLQVTREHLQSGLEKIRVIVINRTPRVPGQNPLTRCLISTHTILTVRGGNFVSLLDPPDAFREAAQKCQNVGTWPVLIGHL